MFQDEDDAQPLEPQDGERARSSLNNSTQTDLGGLVSMSASVSAGSDGHDFTRQTWPTMK